MASVSAPIDAAKLAKALDTTALVEAGGHDIERTTGAVLTKLQRGGLGDMGQVAVVAPHQAEAGDVDHRLGLLIGHLAAHADRDLSVFDAVCHVVVILDTAGPAVDDALADARLLNHRCG